MDLQKICDDVESEWEMGGLSYGLYGDYAKEVARRAVAAEREACAKTAENFDFNDREEIDKPRSLPRYVAASIRKRSNAGGKRSDD